MNKQMSEQERLQEEAEFADQEYSPFMGDIRISQKMLDKYKRPRHMWDWRQRAAKLLGDIRGKAFLDYGCGQGEEAAYFSVLGARVTAIDISTVGIRIGRERAAANGLDIDFRVMSCTPTEFPNESFDIVHGMGILHHVGLADGLREVYRLLKPGGMSVFLEPLGSSAVVEGVKERISGALSDRLGLIPVTSGEENLKLKEIRQESTNWAYYRMYPYRLSYRVRKLLLPKILWEWSLKFDHAVLSVCPPLSYFAGAAVIYLRK